MKRVLSLILVAAMLFAMLPVVSAEEPRNAGMDMGQVDVAGDGSLGTLLTESISQELQERNLYGASCVRSLTVEGSFATVEYTVVTDAIVMVGLYRDDWSELYTSASVNVPAGEGTVTLEFTEEMPDYFQAKVYLLDGKDLSPLCGSYNTPMYTGPMQDLLASTANDYPAEQVLLMGEGTDTNFAVYWDYVTRVTAEEGVNELVSSDQENLVYIFENCDERLTEMEQWDILAYEDGTETLVVGVADASVEGTTVTLYGDKDLRLEEVFYAVKIQAQGSLENAEYDGSNAHEGVDAKLSAGGAARSADIEEQRRLELNLNYMSDDLGDNSSFKLLGLGSLDLSPDLDYYLSGELAWVYLNVHYTLWASLKLEVQGNAFNGGLPLGCLKVPVLPGVHVLFYPEFVVQAKVSASFDFQVDGDVGVALDYYAGHWTPSSYRTDPDVTSDFELDGSILVGVNLVPQLTLVSGYLLSLEVEALVGLELKGTLHQQAAQPATSQIHGCRRCLAGEVALVLKITPSVTVLKRPEMSVTFNNLVDKKWKLFDFYSCAEHNVFLEKGTCPEVKYRVTLEVNDAGGLGISNVLVTADGADLGYTTSGGTITAYFAPGDHQIRLRDTISGIDAAFTIQVAKARRFEYNLDKGLTDDGSSDAPTGGGSSGGGSSADTREEMEKLRQELFAKIEKQNIPVDYGYYTGPDGNQIRWTLQPDGTLYIRGTGSMGDFTAGSTPWYSRKNSIKKVYIEDGITNVASYAFLSCTNLTEVHMAETVTEIGGSAFYDCTALTDTYFSPTITAIGDYAFCGCTSKTYVVLPEELVELGTSAFAGCTAMSMVVFHGNLETIGEYAFSRCKKLSSVDTPDSLRSIGKEAFIDCAALATLFLNEGLETIGEGAFRETSISSVTIPASVTQIGQEAFWDCSALRTVIVNDDPAAPTVIGKSAFADCTALSDLRLNEGLDKIGEQAFRECDALVSVKIPATVTRVDNSVFLGCDALTTVEVLDDPAYPTTFGYSAFSCNSLKTVTMHPGAVSMDGSCFSYCYALETVELPDTMTDLGPRAFFYCRSLTEIRLPTGLTKLEDAVFANCSALTGIEIPGNVTSIGSEAFLDCTSLTEVNTANSLSLATISSRAFSGCNNLSEIEIPAGVTQLSGDAFLGCKTLRSIRVDGANTAYFSDNKGGVYAGEDRSLFLLPPTLEGCYAVAEGTQTIRTDGNLADCMNLTALVLPDSFAQISADLALPESLARITVSESNPWFDSDAQGGLLTEGGAFIAVVPPAFQGRYVVPETVTALGRRNFCSLSDLTELWIPGSVTVLEELAIQSCPNLEWVAFLGDFPEMDENAFEGTETWIYYPYENESWQAADESGAFGDYGGNLLWIPYWSEDEIGVNQPVMSPYPVATTAPLPAPYPGDMVGDESWQELYFDGLVPGEQYMALSLASLDAEDLLDSGNVLFAWQIEADGTGSIGLEYYTSRGADGCYAVALGPEALADIGGAEVALEVVETPEQQLLEPVVTLDGETLTAHEDYTIAGAYMAGPGGEYVFTLEGRGDYTGGLRCRLTIPHSWDEGEETLAPGYGTEGEMAYTCTVCGESRTEAIPALDTCAHGATEVRGSSEPDCDTPGYTGDTYCTVCGELVTQGGQIPAEGHKWSQWTRETAPTIHAPGEELRSCGVCGEEERRPIPQRVNPFRDVAEGDWFFEPVLWAFENKITAGDGQSDTFNPEGVCTRAQVVTFLWRAAGEPEPGTQGVSFSDVPEGEWFAQAVRWAVEQGITMGTGNGRFSPDDPCTRAQVATFLWRAQGSPQPGSSDNPFTDVPEAEYYFIPILWAVENEITLGTGGGKFSPDETCTRAQIVTFLYRAMA